MRQLCEVQICNVSAHYGAGLTYDADRRIYSRSTLVSLKGSIEKRNGANIRLSNGSPTTGLPVFLQLVQGKPLVFSDANSMQTQFGEKLLLDVNPIESCIGDLGHSFAISDKVVDARSASVAL